jgi:hypothetical protein
MMAPEMLKVSDAPVTGGVVVACFVERLWQPTVATSIARTVAQAKLFRRMLKSMGEPFVPN